MVTPVKVHPRTLIRLPSLLVAGNGNVGGVGSTGSGAITLPSILVAAGVGGGSVGATDFVQMGASTSDAPTWGYANRILMYPWTNAGGDWLDAANVQNGSTHYATRSVVFSDASTAFSVGPIVQKMLDRENTGFYFRLAGLPPTDPGYGYPAVYGIGNPTPPTLHVVTSVGTFDCTCSKFSWMAPSSGGANGFDTFPTNMGFPSVMKFDLSAVTGTVSSATLTIFWQTTRGSSWTIYCDYLDMPALVTDPARQLGGQVVGPSGAVAIDTDLEGSVLFYGRMENEADIIADWNPGVHIGGTGHVSITTPTFVDWTDYGVSAIRIESQSPAFNPDPGDGASIMRWENYAPAGLTEAYCRYTIKIDPDVQIGQTEAGVKMPGFEGIGPSMRMEHTAWSAANYGVTRLFCGLYGPLGNAYGNPNRAYPLTTLTCLQAGEIYSIEQRVKQNTIYDTVHASNGVCVVGVGSTAGTFNVDGITTLTPASIVCSSISTLGGSTATTNQFVNPDGGSLPIIFDSATLTPALRGIQGSIFSNTSGATPVFSCGALHAAPAAGDTFIACASYDGIVRDTLPDGALEMWVNGSSVYSNTAAVINNIEKASVSGGRQTILWFENILFHGGRDLPSAPLHWELGPVVIDTSYIGPMKPIQPLWLSTLNLSVNQWGEIPNSAFSTLVAANPAWADSSGVGGAIARAGAVDAMTVWSGKSIDTVHNRVWQIGGISGHFECAINAALVFDLMADAPAWAVDCPSSLSSAVPTGGAASEPYADSKPRATQSYYGQQYDETRDKPMRIGSYAPFNNGGYGTSAGIRYDPVAHAYESLGTIPAHLSGPDGYLTAGGLDILCFKHKTTGDCYVWRSTDMRRWNCATNTWANFGDAFHTYGGFGVGDGVFNGFARVDHRRNTICLWNSDVAFQIDATTGVGIPFGGGRAGFPAITGLAVSVGLGPGGFFFEAADPADDCFLAMPGQGRQTVYRLNASTWVADILPTTGTQPPDWAQAGNGMYDNFLLTGDLGGGVTGAVYFPNGGLNAWFLRLT